jgi:hypothetical protein
MTVLLAGAPEHCRPGQYPAVPTQCLASLETTGERGERPARPTRVDERRLGMPMVGQPGAVPAWFSLTGFAESAGSTAAESTAAGNPTIGAPAADVAAIGGAVAGDVDHGATWTAAATAAVPLTKTVPGSHRGVLQAT